jgi:sRNA-binding protein
MTAETETRLPAPTARRRTEREQQMDAILADWRERWPAAFTQRAPLAVGISRHIKEALQAEGKAIDRKALGITLHRWTMHGVYLRAMARGEMRRNLDGSAAGIPDEAARAYAQQLLDERAARQAAERERQRQQRQNRDAAVTDPTPV